MATIRKILIANRGEIAVRIIRTCKELGIETVAVYSATDETSLHVILADESILIGDAPSSESYLVMDKIIKAAQQSGADAIHPGYGFLSENAQFAQLCEQNEIIFIGPDAQTIKMMGDKTRARETMSLAGIESPPGTKKALNDIDEAINMVYDIGLPVLVKAAAGGGGKGMRIVRDIEDLEKNINASQSEAKSAFGDGRVYIEKYLESPRHVEVQIIADHQGNILHLFDRECSIQRRHQKVIEEAPCAFLGPELREKITRAAVEVAKACNYTNAGTVEFLVDKHNNFYFLEVNTRLQVEHPITEIITGMDLVALQIQIAERKTLPFRQEDISINGHAIECRISAEDPSESFLPSTGKLSTHIVPAGPGVRVDEGVLEGQEITIHYDPLISKLITYGKNRDQAIHRMKRALDEYQVSGVKTTIPFCRFVMEHTVFNKAQYNTHFVDLHYNQQGSVEHKPEETGSDEVVAAVLSAALLTNRKQDQKDALSNHTSTYGQWWAKRGKS